ncbi:HFL095Wp [Eremothecium sinecaudum]|uniref:HFL095Wp n=1 Tax=Eremothecium sinecaudum TaxID=45286 RepID=A0A0X8HTX2_9SACH|nr:HFL095Wp [Eremothecium sinecaudum]AMD21761.1 HFL095Wp [Eremothecium sinecaudum]
MSIWPFEANHCFEVPIAKYVSQDENSEHSLNNKSILQTIKLPSSNLFVLLTDCAVFLYNSEPLCLISCHRSSIKAIERFGNNKSIILNDGQQLHGDIMRKEQGKAERIRKDIYFYVVTENNFMLVYQISSNSDGSSNFVDYDLHVSKSLRTRLEIQEKFEADNNEENEVLIVYDKSDSSKIIQSGYATHKQRGFLQFLTNNNAEDENESPINKSELNLKVVLSFDHGINDVIGESLGNIGDGQSQQSLTMLFDKGLQLLELTNFKLQESTLIEVQGGRSLLSIEGKLFIIALKNDKYFSICSIDVVKKRIIKEMQLTEVLKASLLSSFAYHNNIIILVFQNEVVYYNLVSEDVIGRLKLSGGIRKSSRLTDDLMALFMTDGTIKVTSVWGNTLFVLPINDHLGKANLPTDIAFFDKTLIVSTNEGNILVWSMWTEISTSIGDLRQNTPFLLQNKKGDVQVYSPISGGDFNHNMFQLLKFPTKTANNYIPIVRLNDNQSILAVYVANKGVLLLNFLNLGKLLSFSDVKLLDCYWIKSNYLLCHFGDSSGRDFMQCFHFPSQGNHSAELNDYTIWKWSVPHNITVRQMFVNTFSKYKSVRIKAKNGEENHDNLLKTTEIVLLCEGGKVTTFDVLCIVHPCGVNIIRHFHHFKEYQLPIDLIRHLIWIYSWKGGFIALSASTVYRIEFDANYEYTTVSLLEKVDRIIDIVGESICLVVGNDFLVYDINDLWEQKAPTVKIPLVEEEYPICVSVQTAAIHNMNYLDEKAFIKLSVDSHIYLDHIIAKLVDGSIPPEEIHNRYGALKHYKFVLEKVLSSKVLNNESLDGILNLLDVYDTELSLNTPGRPVSGKIEIVGNCLRKIETKHWDYLFHNLRLTPRDLLERCTENGDPKILGVLLVVFLNYDENNLLYSARNANEKASKSKSNSKKGKKHKQNKNYSKKNHTHVETVLRDEELIQRVLHVLVTSASNSAIPQEAQEYWDMALQVVRFTKALDKQNESTLASKCMNQL